MKRLAPQENVLHQENKIGRLVTLTALRPHAYRAARARQTATTAPKMEPERPLAALLRMLEVEGAEELPVEEEDWPEAPEAPAPEEPAAEPEEEPEMALLEGRADEVEFQKPVPL